MSQPAMSRALARLRHLLNDQLLVRSGSTLVLTPRARQLLPLAIGALDAMRVLFEETTFDPSTVRRTVRIAGSDVHGILIAPALMHRLAIDAPGLDLRIVPYAPDMAARMDVGEIDMAFALASSPLPPGAMSMRIGSDRLALVMRQGHPAAGRAWSIADYARFDHVGIALLGDGQSELDAMLAAAGVRRRIALVTPSFAAALATVAATDFVTTLSARFAARFADAHRLLVRDAPFAGSALEMTLVWSQVQASDPLLIWLRGAIRDTAEAAFAEDAGQSAA